MSDNTAKTAIIDKLRGTGQDPLENLPVLTTTDRRVAADEIETLRTALQTLVDVVSETGAPKHWAGLWHAVEQANIALGNTSSSEEDSYE